MNIVVEQSGYALLNVGDIAMLQVLVLRLRRLSGSGQIWVVAEGPDSLAELIPDVFCITRELRDAALGKGCVLGRFSSLLYDTETTLLLKAPWLTTRVTQIKRRLRGGAGHEILEVLRVIRDADLVVAAGGGYLTDTFPSMVRGVCRTLEYAQSLGKPTAMFGQGIGPLEGRALRKVAGSALRKLEIIALREGHRGPDILNSLGVAADKVLVTGDDAIELVVAERQSSIGTALGLNIRTADYADLPAEALRDLGDIVAKLAERYAARIERIAISFGSNHEDLRAIEMALSRHAEHNCDVPHPPARVPKPTAVIRQVGACRVVVTGSYHAAVFALAQGIPVVSLAKSQYYVDKFSGLSELFGCGCQVVILDVAGWQSVLEDSIARFWKDSEAIRPNLIAAADAQLIQSQQAFARLETLVRRAG